MNENKLPFGRVALYSMASAGLNILAITLDTWILYFTRRRLIRAVRNICR